MGRPGLLPLIRRLKSHHPQVTQPWHADDAGAAGKFEAIKAMFKEFKEIGPEYGYFPEPRKSITVVTPENLQSAQQYFADEGFKVVTGSRCLGGFIVSKAELEVRLDEKITMWAEALGGAFSNIAKRFPQTAYTGVVKSFQQEWQFLQRIIAGIGKRFGPIAEAIIKFLEALFSTKIDHQIDLLGELPIKYGGLAIPNPTKTSEKTILRVRC